MATTQTQAISVPYSANAFSPESNASPTPLPGILLDSFQDDQVPVMPQTSAKTSRLQNAILVVLMSGITFTGSLINGLVTVGLPAITADLKIPPSLAFWPASVSSLATASTLLLAGSVADVLGPRRVDLVGSFASGALMIAAGASRQGSELIALRALQGVGLSLHLASSVSIITKALPQGRGRNLAFSCLGLSQPLGLSVGLVLGGVFVDTIGWRAGWYLSGGLTLLLASIAIWALPRSNDLRSMKNIWHDMKIKVDWVGAMLASAFMTLLCYLLAILSADVTRIKEPLSIAFLCLSVVALMTFIYWMHIQVKANRPALIPNSLWRNTTFSGVCMTIALSNAVINSMELFCSLFFQDIQLLPALQASIRILPSTTVGIIMNFTVGLFVHKVPVVWIVMSTSILCAGASLLMAVIQPSWPYWGNAFVAQLLMPLSCDALFTVGLIIISDVFPDDTQALAGAVFNTAAQFGGALGLAILQVISTTVTEKQTGMEMISALMEGYRASFWTMFAFMILCAAIGTLGLKNTGKIGLKKD
ncbi:hypothetical protein AUP68_09482 [Ilyonectria robusta]